MNEQNIQEISDEPIREDSPQRSRKLLFSAFYESEGFFISIILVMLLLSFVLLPRTVNGPSMTPTLLNEDKIVISNLFFNPSRGDIIVVTVPSSPDPYVKRIIATEGETIDINFLTGEVSIDGIVIDEPYINNPTINEQGLIFPYTVEEGHIFVMGDNRQHSMDSRSLTVGTLDARNIQGRVIFKYFPTFEFVR